MKKLYATIAQIFFFFLIACQIAIAQDNDNASDNEDPTIEVTIIKAQEPRPEPVFIKNELSQSNSIKSVQRRMLFAQREASPTIEEDEEEAGNTPAKLGISLTGAATYSVPFVLPPGIKNVAPKLGLAFNSHSGNGLAGWGWNVSGLSTITRIPSTKFHDGIIDPVDYDGYDRFSLNGQRLILVSGRYGQHASYYATENLSNIRVEANGQNGSGLSYFKVYSPNGSKAWYGSTSGSRSAVEWAIHRWEDAQGNYILYDYEKNGGLLRISKISYGARGQATSPNTITFHYKTRNRPELVLINNTKLLRSNILEQVEIRGRGGALYRKYKLFHDQTLLGYNRVKSIQEYNGAGKEMPNLTFNYENYQDGIKYFGSINISPGAYYGISTVVPGDFNGDGHIDLIDYDKQKYKIRVFDNLFTKSKNIAKIIHVGHFLDVFPSTILDPSGKMLGKQAITVVKNTGNYKDQEITFRSLYRMVSSSSKYSYFDRKWSPPTYNNNPSNSITVPNSQHGTYIARDIYAKNVLKSGADVYYGGTRQVVLQPGFHAQSGSQLTARIVKSPGRRIPQKFVPGDFNGDGFTDVLAISINANAPAYFIDLYNRKTNNFSNNTGDLNLVYFQEGDRLMTGDFNGDGKTDLFHFRDKAVSIYELNSDNQLVLLYRRLDSVINMDLPILLGDYNGDRKTDFLVPKGKETDVWEFYYSTGKKIIGVTKTLPIYYEYGGHHNEYIPQDVNGDGKTDLIKHTIYPYDYKNSSIINVFSNMGSFNGYAVFKKTDSYKSNTINSMMANYGFPIFLNVDKRNENLEYVYLAGENIYPFQFTKDHRIDITLSEIRNNGIVQRIDYGKLEKSHDVYASDQEEYYPYVNINNAPYFKLVSKVTENADGITRNQDFRYKGAVFHAEGLGFLGFKWMARSNIYGKDVEQVWSILKHDPQKRGAVSERWTSTAFSFTPDHFIQKTNFAYQTQLLSNKVFVNVPTQAVKDDRLQGITTTKRFEYDQYYNILKSTTSFPGGSNTIETQYSNNALLGSSYHIGRPTYKKKTRVLGQESFSTETQYAYSGALLTSKKSKAMGSDWLTEAYGYDAYGNMTRRTISGNGVASRSESLKYSSDGRFLTELTDTEGLKTKFSYDAVTGNVLTSTNPYGLTTSLSYDGWNRLVAESDYLNHVTRYFYSLPYDQNGMKIEVQAPDGSRTREYTNKFGWTIKSEVLSLDEKWIQKEFQYDITGKILKESEPFFETPNQWNSTGYDKYGRLISHELYTGKTISTEYDGLSVTVGDGTKTVTTTKDALGNIVRLQDLGGTINYTYFANGAMKSANYGDHAVTIKIDEWGRKKELNDPSAGKYTYEYNILGETTKETTPKGYTKYQYDAVGKVMGKKVSGDQTDLALNYVYDNTTKLLMSMSGVDAVNNNNYAYTYAYDRYKRPQSVSENMGAAKFSKRWTYDNLGRQQTEEIGSELLNGMSSAAQTSYVYGSSGALREVKSGNKTLWKLEATNHREQPTLISLGNGQKKHLSYDQYGTIQHILHNKSGGATALDIAYDFNPQRGILNKRERRGITQNPYKELFSYDKLDRLTNISGAVNKIQSYEADGRILENSSLGVYNYDPAKRYRLATMDLNEKGQAYYEQHTKQEITYNVFKNPVEVHEKGHGRVSFQYGPLMGRSHAYYGDEQEDKLERRYRKYYSSIVPVEIVQDRETGKDKIVTYVYGNPYDAPAVHIKQTGNNGNFYYLHRDYLGSILAITDAAGSLVEQRQFGAWGTADYFSKGLQASAFNHENSLLSRGYTGHEHFFGVSLIHMNGRMYDANLGRFLSPDNNIQEPFNTQSFNRYSYTVNNPLKYIDPSGESWDDNDLWPPDEDEYEDENKDKDIEWTWNEDEDVNIEWTWNGNEWIGEITEVEYIIYNSSQEESFEDSDDGFGGLDDSFRNFDDRFENSNGFSGYDGFDQGPVRKREKYIRLKNQDNRFGEPGLVPLSGEIFLFIVSEGAVAGISAALKGVRWVGRGVRNVIPKGKLAGHIFSNKAGKLIDNVANRKLITNLTNNSKHLQGIDKYGKSWYAHTLDNGTQIYSYTRNGIVKGAGINQTPVNFIKRYRLK